MQNETSGNYAGWNNNGQKKIKIPLSSVGAKAKLKSLLLTESEIKSEIEVAHSCPTLCDPMDCRLSGSSIHGIFQARVLEWISISFSRDLPGPGIKPGSPALQADALPSEPPGKPSAKTVHINPCLGHFLLVLSFGSSE